MNVLTKPMKNAEYFCAGNKGDDMDQFRHYALSVPLYTHFTSPIRRYPDVLVHRYCFIFTCKSLSEARIFASTNLQYEDRLFIELQVQYVRIPSSNLGRTFCVQKLFLTFRTIFVHNMFSPGLSLEFSCIEPRTTIFRWT